MGPAQSQSFIDEKETWALEHSLGIDKALQGNCVRLIENNFILGDKLQMQTFSTTAGNVTVLHYFICTKKKETAIPIPRWVLEFAKGGDLLNSNEREHVHVHCKPKKWKDCKVEKEFRLTEEVMERMKAVAGATKFSMALRNSEHVARYVYSGSWISMQMATTQGGGIGTWLKPSLSKTNDMGKCNERPIELQEASESEEVVIPGLDPIIEYKGKYNAQDRIDDGAFNIVIIGPTGCGKSYFLNRLFNRKLAKEGEYAKSVQKHMQAYKGEMKSLVGNQPMNVNVIDTVGFCDSSLNPKEVCQLVEQYLKNKVGYVDKLVVLTYDRLEQGHKDSIHQILQWLGFYGLKNKGCFLFIYNKADQCRNESIRQENVAYMASELETGNYYADQAFGDQTHRILFNVPLGIPPNANQKVVEDELSTIRIQLDQFFVGGVRQRIKVDPQISRHCNNFPWHEAF